MFSQLFLAISYAIAVTAEQTLADLTVPEYCSSLCKFLAGPKASYATMTETNASASDITLGLFIPLTSKPTTSSDITSFLETGLQLVKAEPATLQWFAVKLTSNTTDDPETFAIFDTFASQAGRDAHLEGKVAEALLTNANTLLRIPPPIQQFEIFTSLVRPVESQADDDNLRAGLEIGLQILVEAKDPDAVRDFMCNALSLVEEEDKTMAWYAIEFPGTNMFAIFNFFADEAGRELHLNGKVLEALSASADELFVSAPEIVKLDVLFANM